MDVGSVYLEAGISGQGHISLTSDNVAESFSLSRVANDFDVIGNVDVSFTNNHVLQVQGDMTIDRGGYGSVFNMDNSQLAITGSLHGISGEIVMSALLGVGGEAVFQPGFTLNIVGTANFSFGQITDESYARITINPLGGSRFQGTLRLTSNRDISTVDDFVNIPGADVDILNVENWGVLSGSGVVTTPFSNYGTIENLGGSMEFSHMPNEADGIISGEGFFSFPNGLGKSWFNCNRHERRYYHC